MTYPQIGCQLFSLVNAGTCQALCAAQGLKTSCANGDGCCPGGCTSRDDSDCAAACGNGVVEAGESATGIAPPSVTPSVANSVPSSVTPVLATPNARAARW